MISSLIFLTVRSFPERVELIFLTPFVYLPLTLVYLWLNVQLVRVGRDKTASQSSRATTRPANPFPTSGNPDNLMP
ncbi:hypothetical protein [Corynebacterium efficiens YS-314]|uniref:Uncharacterized protein n=1 Tax=Corynebacterium efficiens (strain DSM 44549 / YS-314 / AJ 12310 / JCM 11189 / NBRC 100395) TaxID=196164 RepID=Q8FQT9_COREF|nr:hypothetical protein [Corynebacterium efficiens YS-314]